MTNPNTVKKPALEDWHPADIKATLEKAGWTLSRLSRSHGYHRSAASHVLRHPWPKLERVIAEAIGLQPQDLWPSRYTLDGRPNRPRGRPSQTKSTSRGR